MIALSVALVLLALVLLVAGLAATGLTLVYASLVASLLGCVALVAAVHRRRRPSRPAAPLAAPLRTPRTQRTPRTPPATEDEDERDEQRPRSSLTWDTPVPDRPTADDSTPPADDGELFDGLVWVVPGRPRYHAQGCSYLGDRDVEPRDVLDAREEGFTACLICRPEATPG